MTGGAASGRKGAAYEQELVNRFLENGYGALRLGASGSGGDADLPDVLAGRREALDGMTGPIATRTDVWAVELKSGSQTTLYVDADEVGALTRFAHPWGAKPLLGARFTFDSGEHYNRTGTYLLEPDDARRTDGGQYGLPVADVDERAFAVVRDESVERL